MNIFVLDRDIVRNAQFHCNKHVVKMILESAQLLSTACYLHGMKTAPYKPTHINHPCTKWVCESQENWLWLQKLTRALNHEYMFRYGKNVSHKSAVVAESLVCPDTIPNIGLTPPALAMPDQYKGADVVHSYRNYYIGEKQAIADWGNRGVPHWFIRTQPE